MLKKKSTHLATGKEATVTRFEPGQLRSKKRDVKK